jgi:hypothetical protein
MGGIVDGGSNGTDTLDYASYTTPLQIQLGEGNANIDAVIGGAGADTLVGLNATNVWTIDGAGSGTLAATSSKRLRLDGGETEIDTVTDRIRLPYLHDFSTGDRVRYTSIDQDAALQSGLISGTDYYVVGVDDQSFSLATSAPVLPPLAFGNWSAGDRRFVNASGLPLLSFDGSAKSDAYANTITFANAHGLVDGDRVTYRYDGAGDTSGLINQTEYWVLKVDDTTIKRTVLQIKSSKSWSCKIGGCSPNMALASGFSMCASSATAPSVLSVFMILATKSMTAK